MKALLIAVSITVAAGCATSAPEPTTTVASVDDAGEPTIVCRREKPTGSNRPVKVCRAVGDAFDKEATRRDMQVLQRQSDILSMPEN